LELAVEKAVADDLVALDVTGSTLVRREECSSIAFVVDTLTIRNVGVVFVHDGLLE
jgi:hypothetical protein